MTGIATAQVASNNSNQICLLLLHSTKHGLKNTDLSPLTLTRMVLANFDVGLDYPRPLPPNVQAVGPIMASPAKKMSPELEKLLDSAGSPGAILVSMGTTFSLSKPSITAVYRRGTAFLCSTTKQSITQWR